MYEIFPSYLFLLNVQFYSEICLYFEVKLVMSNGYEYKGALIGIFGADHQLQITGSSVGR